MTRMHTLSALALAAVLGAGCSMMPMPGLMPAKTMNNTLVGNNSMTLYTFDRDGVNSGKSVCNGPCATNWPPLMAEATSSSMGDWTVITRDDGARQWAYKGKPMYFWAKDAKPGDATGDGVGGVWHTAKP
jgi:predicted lipoprotein with Yx(FWY)xxD motif